MRYTLSILCLSLAACGVESDPEPALGTLEQGCGAYGDFVDPFVVANASEARPSDPARVFAARHDWLDDTVDLRDPRARLVASLHEARARLAECEVKPVDGFEDRSRDADLRITRFAADGPLVPGTTVTFTVAMAEVAGVDHMRYPGVGLAFDPPVAELAAHAGTLYGINACQEVVFELPVALPADLEVDTAVTVSALAGLGICNGEEACLSSDAVLMRQVIQP